MLSHLPAQSWLAGSLKSNKKKNSGTWQVINLFSVKNLEEMVRGNITSFV